MHVAWDHLFEVLLRQVWQMRVAQKAWLRAHPNGGTPALFALEAEVDNLIEMHQLGAVDQLNTRGEQLRETLHAATVTFTEDGAAEEELAIIASVAVPCIRFCRALAHTLDAHNPNVEEWLHSAPMDAVLERLEPFVE